MSSSNKYKSSGYRTLTLQFSKIIPWESRVSTRTHLNQLAFMLSQSLLTTPPRFITAFFLLLLALALSAQTITVKQDSTGNFTTIQAAINASLNGDTVLVYPGIYFENINFNGKNITVGSLLLTTGDENYKYNTIIDGDNSGSCVVVNNNENNAQLTGFTLQHGSGHKIWWDTTFIIGGGVLLDNVNFLINHCIIQNNRAENGGGIDCRNYSNLTLKKVTIRNNYVTETGGGLVITSDAKVTFDSIERCNLYLNYASRGCEIHKAVENDTLHVYLDTCTVLEPDYYFFSSIQFESFYIDDIVYNINHAKLTPVDGDLYVNPVSGNDSAGGLSPDDPLKTIAYAYSKIAVDSNERNTIRLANGIYSDTVNGEKFPLNIRPYINVVGQSRDGTILDGEYKSKLLMGNTTTSNYSFSKMTIRRGTKVIYYAFNNSDALVRLYRQNDNVTFDSILFTEGRGTPAYGMVAMYGSNNLVINNCEISNSLGCSALSIPMWGNDSCYIKNCIISNNKPDFNNPEYVIGKGMFISNGVGVIFNSLFLNNDDNALVSLFPKSENYLVNCTFSENSFLRSFGAVFSFDETSNYFYNCIVYGNNTTHPTFPLSNFEHNEPTILNIYYSLIEGGEGSIELGSGCNGFCHYYYDTTNIDTDPLFYGGEEFPYNLSDESPCIDAGTLDLPQFILDHMPDVDLAGNPRIFNGKIDMGAYEWNPTVGTEQHPTPNAERQTPNLQAYPNPFRTQTTITAKWNKSARVNIEIYNNAGLLVKTLQSGKQLPGSCKIPWNGTDNSGNILPAGIYYVVLRVNAKETKSVKVVRN